MTVEGKENMEVLNDQVEATQESLQTENLEQAVVVVEEGKVAHAIQDLKKSDEVKVDEKEVPVVEIGTVAEAIKDLVKGDVNESKRSDHVEEKGVDLIGGAKVSEVVKELEKVMSPVISPKSDGISPRERMISPKQRIISPKAEVISPKEKVISPKEEMAISSKEEKAIIPKAEVISPKGENDESEKGECSSPSDAKEDEGSFSELKGSEKKALTELRSRIEEAILTNMLFVEKKEFQKVKSSKKVGEESVKDKEQEEKQEKDEEKTDVEGGTSIDKGKLKVEDEEVIPDGVKEMKEQVDENICLWGVPLLPSKGDKGTDVLLLKFLIAREFKVNDAFDMLKNTLKWRKENKIDSILEEDLGNIYDSMAYTRGVDREGHIVCYNVYGVFANDEMYNKTFGTEAARERFLRWRLQLMEKQIQKVDFKSGDAASLLQINDLKNTPGPSRKDLRQASRRAVEILQDNYPELVSRNIFINVPFWYYAFNALLSPFLTQRTKSKFIFSRPSRVADTLVKYICAEKIPVQYGGLRKENDPEFSTEDPASEITVRAGTTETIEIPAPEVGNALIWDLTVVGWDVTYKEEFVPTDQGSYTVIVKKSKKISWQDDSIRNSFRNNEPGKVVITIDNGIFKRKRVFYRYKTLST